jgi:processive 1,2-diacylglycerol beta-glucosyltransferase
MKKILILTAGYGEGHNSAARALQSAFNENPAIEAELIDLFALRAPRLNNFSRRAYVKVINTAPKIWSAIYGWLDRSPLVPLTFKALGSHRELLGRLIAEKKPSAICSTYPIYAWLLNDLRRRGQHFRGVVCDRPRLWCRALHSRNSGGTSARQRLPRRPGVR